MSRCLTSGSASQDNRIVQRAVSTLVAALLALAVASAAWADCTGDQPDGRARMKCCAAGHHQCPMRGNPDDCCRRMSPRGPSATAATAATAKVALPVAYALVALLEWPPADDHLVETLRASFPGVRLHDPPHLHAFVLLI
jgi:hypothetical protein